MKLNEDEIGGWNWYFIYLFMREGWRWFDFKSWGIKLIQIIVWGFYIYIYIYYLRIIYIYIYIFFFFEHKLEYHCQKEKGSTTKHKKRSSTQYNLSTICLDNVRYHRRTDPLPNMRNFILPCILRKLMSYSVVFSFHMFDSPAGKKRKQIKNSLIHMTKTAICFNCYGTINSY